MRLSRNLLQPAVCLCVSLMMQSSGFAASHREAPITALDQKADITATREAGVMGALDRRGPALTD